MLAALEAVHRGLAGHRDEAHQKTTYLLCARYKPAADTAVYGRIATGYRPGGPSALAPDVVPGGKQTFEPDTRTSYELGFKSALLGGGLLVQSVGWRAGFVWLGLAGLVMAVVFHLTVREPVRRERPTAQQQGSLWSQLGDARAFWLLVMAFSTTALAGSSVMVWLPSYFERAFALPPVVIGGGLGLCIGVATAVGSVVGGQLGVKRAGGSRSWGAGFAARATVLVMPFFLGCFYAPWPLLAFALLFGAFAIAGTILGPVFSTLQDLVSPTARATALAVVALFGVVVGQGLGPLLVGAISDALHVKGADAAGLRTAMTLVACVNFLTIVAFWRLKRRIDAISPARPVTVDADRRAG